MMYSARTTCFYCDSVMESKLQLATTIWHANVIRKLLIDNANIMIVYKTITPKVGHILSSCMQAILPQNEITVRQI